MLLKRNTTTRALQVNMISYHPGSLTAPVGTPFTRGFKTADIDDPKRIANGIAKYVWSPCQWTEGYRAKKNFIRANWFALDFDSGEMSLRQAENIFCDMIHVIGTTRNHQKNKDGITCDRFRVLLKASKDMTDVRVYEGNIRRLIAKWPVDKSCCDGARFFFKCSDIVSVIEDGYTEDVTSVAYKEEISGLDYGLLLEKRKIYYDASGELPPSVESFLKKGASKNRHNSAYGAAMGLLEVGFDPNDVIALIKKAPITRPYRPGEVEDIVSHALQRIKRRLAEDGGSNQHGGQADKGFTELRWQGQ